MCTNFFRDKSLFCILFLEVIMFHIWWGTMGLRVGQYVAGGGWRRCSGTVFRCKRIWYAWKEIYMSEKRFSIPVMLAAVILTAFFTAIASRWYFINQKADGYKSQLTVCIPSYWMEGFICIGRKPEHTRCIGNCQAWGRRVRKTHWFFRPQPYGNSIR